jgi:hypothetical protein
MKDLKLISGFIVYTITLVVVTLIILSTVL